MNTLRLIDRKMIEAEVDKTLRTARVGRLGLCRNGQPYVVPINFAYENGRIYFHCADVGMKIEFLRDNPSVCFEVDEHHGIMAAPMVCNYDTAYRSVIASGTARILTDLKEKTVGLKSIVAKYAGRENAEKLESKTVDGYRSPQGSKTIVVEITIERITGKSYGVK
jgi:nitroimidazol reductase NimA-like FMN-containing flavoprotein (pyridoxamine 5'-phosphate oxidase superfamily)